MNYLKIYNNLITSRQTRKFKSVDYYEVHHILPKCLGGTNDKSNLIKLTAREHYIAHWLLTKLYPNNYKIWSAFALMSGRLSPLSSREFTAVAFERCRKAQSIATSLRIANGWNPGASENSRTKAKKRMTTANPISIDPSVNWTARAVTVYLMDGSIQKYKCGKFAANSLGIPYATWKWCLRYANGKSLKHNIEKVEQDMPKPSNKKFSSCEG